MASDFIKTDRATEDKLLEYINSTAGSSDSWWQESISGTTENRRSRLDRLRLRYNARRSVAQLFNDIKTQPYRRANNVGVGIEQIFGEWLTANCLANTVDLDPPIDVYDPTTRKNNEPLEQFYTEQYLHQLGIRTTYETLIREIFTVGCVFSKWESSYNSRKRRDVMFVMVDPTTKQPIEIPNERGELDVIEADPETRKEDLPFTPNGQAMVRGIVRVVHGNGSWKPKFRIRTIEQVRVPPTATTQDPNDWDYFHEEYTVSAWWFLSREGEMHEGGIPRERLDRIWKAINVRPDEAWRRPDGQLIKPIRVRESHLKFPMTRSGEPVEMVVTSLPDHNQIITYDMTRTSRRPYFNHQVYHRTNHWMGKGIPETLYSLRNAMDALLNQDLDAGNLYNQPPLLISSLAGLDDETFEMAGPGAVWYMRDINGLKFLPPPIRQRDPITMLNWLVSMAQRLWGVTDLNLNAPSGSLSPNIKTATGVLSATNNANIKFGHFIRNVETIRTQEVQMMHEEFADKWTGIYPSVDAEGNKIEITRKDLLPHLRVRAVGDGVQTNPELRQKRMLEVFLVHAKVQNPIVMGDPDVMYDFTKKINDSSGISIPIKKPQEMEDMRLARQLVNMPSIQRVMPTAMEELQVSLSQAQEAEKGENAQPVPA